MQQMWGLPPALDMDYERRVHFAIREIVQAGLVESAHDLGDGGLGVALAECCAGGMGAMIHLATELQPEIGLFHEGPSRILISTAHPEDVQQIARKHKVNCLNIGITTNDRLWVDNEHFVPQRVATDKEVWLDQPVAKLREVWQTALEKTLHVR